MLNVDDTLIQLKNCYLTDYQINEEENDIETENRQRTDEEETEPNKKDKKLKKLENLRHPEYWNYPLYKL